MRTDDERQPEARLRDVILTSVAELSGCPKFGVWTNRRLMTDLGLSIEDTARVLSAIRSAFDLGEELSFVWWGEDGTIEDLVERYLPRVLERGLERPGETG